MTLYACVYVGMHEYIDIRICVNVCMYAFTYVVMYDLINT